MESSQPAHGVHLGAHVFTSDGHAAGTVIEVLTDEFIVEEGALVKHAYSYRYDAVASATPERVDLTWDNTALRQTWNILTLRDAHGRDRHVTQVGVAPTKIVPTYDEVQTTTGGPPTGEEEEEQ
jgi:hypothetical protein